MNFEDNLIVKIEKLAGAKITLYTRQNNDVAVFIDSTLVGIFPKRETRRVLLGFYSIAKLTTAFKQAPYKAVQ